MSCKETPYPRLLFSSPCVKAGFSNNLQGVRDGQVEVYNSSHEAEAQYNFQVRYYARGGSNHFYKKLNLFVYYEDIFHGLNKNKDEESYES